jgi:FkbM family methyltransferase
MLLEKKTMFSLLEILDQELVLNVVNVGASDMGNSIPEPYESLHKAGRCRIIGFEPNETECQNLTQTKSDHEVYLPYAIGDGSVHTYRYCQFFGMNSLLNPNMKLLNETHHHGQLGTVIKTAEILTKRLDEIEEVTGMDYLKMDIQGGELMVVQHGAEKLKSCMVIHSEVMFVPMYENQPLFSEIEIFLRQQGFILHHFNRLHSLMIKPLVLQLPREVKVTDQSGQHDGISQLFFADAIFIRDFTKTESIDKDKLLKLCLILHDMYKSFDMVLNLLLRFDSRFNTQLSQAYVQRLSSLSSTDFIKPTQKFPPPSLVWV